MNKHSLNPFVYGKPVPAKRLIGRRDAVRTCFARLFNGESSAIVGEPHIGKTSVLKYIADKDVRRKQLGKNYEQQLFIEIDCHMIASDLKPADFWRQVFEEAIEISADDSLLLQREIVVKNNYGSFSLESFFKLLAKKGWCIVLLIDEFDALLNHPNFNKAEFLGALRSLATRTDGLVIITASRVSVAQMNRKSQEINPYGSPFFNNVTEVRLLSLSHDEARYLIDSTLQGASNGIRFSANDYAFLFATAGRHPYLLQMAAASLYDVYTDSETEEALFDKALKLFEERSDAHFWDFWTTLTPTEQRALIILGLAQYKGHVDKRSFDLGRLGNLEWYTPDLRHLRDMGVVETEAETSKTSVAWGGQIWQIAVGSIVPWLMDNIVAGTREASDFAGWLRDKEREGLFTRDESAKLKQVGGEISKGAATMAGNAAAEFIKSFIPTIFPR